MLRIVVNFKGEGQTSLGARNFVFETYMILVGDKSGNIRRAQNLWKSLSRPKLNSAFKHLSVTISCVGLVDVVVKVIV